MLELAPPSPPPAPVAPLSHPAAHQVLAHIAARAPPAPTTISLLQSEDLKRYNNVAGAKFDLLQSTETLSYVSL